jgi:hypothetical protein
MKMKNYIYVIKINTMKNKVLFTLMICFATLTIQAQTIPNYSFENWVVDTNYLDLTITNPVTLDTAISTNPASWTTVNEIMGGKIFHNKNLVTQSATHYVGNSSIQLRTDSVSASFTGVPILNTLALNFVCPGFAVCGNFPINLSSFVNLSGAFNPALLPGAGIPVSARYNKIGGYIKNAPIGGDSAYIVAVLRLGTTVIATATYTRDITDAGWVYFEAPFVYQSCLVPDTMVYTLSSGNPYSISKVATGGQSGQHIGSTVLIDSVFLGDTIPASEVAIAVNDSAHTTKNIPVSIPVTANDQACAGGTFTLATGTNPNHGTISVSGDSIIYTPSAGYVGYDTFTYTESVGGGPSSTAQVIVRVAAPLGINEVTEGKINIYPNPATNKLYVSASNPSVSELRIYDMLGKVMKTESFYANTAVDLSGFSNGLYIIQFSGTDGKMISSSRFIVVK